MGFGNHGGRREKDYKKSQRRGGQGTGRPVRWGGPVGGGVPEERTQGREEKS